MIDPIQFRPYNPRKDNKPIYVPDTSKGIADNTDRILRDMDAANNMERQNDQARIDNAKVAGENLQRLGQFSETLSKLGTEAMNRYIDAEEDRAFYDDFNTEQPPSEDFQELEAEASSAELVETEGLTSYEEAGGSPVIAESVRTGSWWYRRKRNQLQLQRSAGQFPLWWEQNKESLTVTVNGQELSWGDVKSTSQLAAFRTAAMQQYSSQFRGYDRNALSAYLYPTLTKEWDKIESSWLAGRTTEIKDDRKTEAEDTLYTGLKTPDKAQAIWNYWQLRMKQGLSSSDARKELSSFLTNNEILFTPDDIDRLRDFDVTWNDGSTRKLGEVFGRELDDLEERVSDNIGRDLTLSTQELEAKRNRYKAAWQQKLATGWIPTQDELADLERDWISDGLGDPGSFFTDQMTVESLDQTDALNRLRSIYTDRGFITEKDLEGMPLSVRNSDAVKEMLQASQQFSGMDFDTDLIQDRADGLTNDFTKLSAGERNTEKYYQTRDRVRSDLYSLWVQEIKTGKYTREDGTVDYQAALNQAAAQLREKHATINADGVRAYDPGKPESYGQEDRRGDSGYLRRLRDVRTAVRDDPETLNTTRIFNDNELEQARKFVLNGTGTLPPLAVDLARGQKNLTSYDIAIAQLELAGIDVKRPEPERTPRQAGAYQELLDFYPTPERYARYTTPNYNDDSVLYRRGSFNPTGVPNGYGNTVMEAAREYNIDPSILAGLISTESSWDPNAVSPVGARGLGQFMPDTAAEFDVDVNDPTSSIYGSARYFSWLKEQFDGDIKLALTAYNGGIGNVQYYGGAIPDNKENQEYAEKVLRNARKYVYRGDGGDQLNLQGSAPSGAVPPSGVVYIDQTTASNGEGGRQCFSATSTMLANAYGIQISYDDYNVIRGRYGDTTLPSSQISALKELGLDATVQDNGSLSDIRQIVGTGRPVAIGINHNDNGGHWILVTGITSTGDYIVHDPAGRLVQQRNGGWAASNRDQQNSGQDAVYTASFLESVFEDRGPGTGRIMRIT